MRMRPGLGLAGMLLLATFCAGSAPDITQPTGVADDTLRRDLAALVEQLGAEDFTTRELASRRIVEKGEAALPVLREISGERREYEVRLQLRRVSRQILDGLTVSRSTGIKFVAVDAGSFFMGSPGNEPNRRDDELLHAVRLSRPFLLGEHEVTQREFGRLMGFQPSAFSASGTLAAAVTDIDTSAFPVENVTWFDALEFCNRLSRADEYAPYYELTEVQKKGDSIKAARVLVRGGAGYRLPTEAEWEYACRSGSSTPFNFGFQGTGREGNFKSGASTGYGGPPTWKSAERPTPFDKFPLAGWGFRDLHGNVAEWCWDWYDREYYRKGPANAAAVDPAGPSTGTQRTARGGSWLVMEAGCRSAQRLLFSPDGATNYLGFRVARTP